MVFSSKAIVKNQKAYAHEKKTIIFFSITIAFLLKAIVKNRKANAHEKKAMVFFSFTIAL